MAVNAAQLKLGRRLALRLPKPQVREVGDARLVTQQVEGLTGKELLALSEFYRWRYGELRGE